MLNLSFLSLTKSESLYALIFPSSLSSFPVSKFLTPSFLPQPHIWLSKASAHSEVGFGPIFTLESFSNYISDISSRMFDQKSNIPIPYQYLLHFLTLIALFSLLSMMISFFCLDSTFSLLISCNSSDICFSSMLITLFINSDWCTFVYYKSYSTQTQSSILLLLPKITCLIASKFFNHFIFSYYYNIINV